MASALYHLIPDEAKRSKAITTRDIPAGTEFVFDPLVTVVNAEESVCENCLLFGEGLLRCSRCKQVTYCSAECQAESWTKGMHKHWCKKQRPDFPSDLKLLLRLALALTQGSPLAETFNELIAAQDVLSPIHQVQFEHNAKIIHAILPNLHEADLVTIQAKNLRNSFTVTDGRLFDIGSGVYPMASRHLNHSCYPNCGVSFRGPKMVVKTLVELKEGDELCINYCDPIVPLEKRRKALEDQYAFKCTCEACTGGGWFETLRQARKTADEIDVNAEEALNAIIRSSISEQILLALGSDPDNTLHARQKVLTTLKIPPVFLNISVLSLATSRSSSLRTSANWSESASYGLYVLAYYLLIYPPAYALVGLHASDLAITMWNAGGWETMVRGVAEFAIWSLGRGMGEGEALEHASELMKAMSG
ncbi:hypothetical protein YB2330_001659 [Saitoella coloradoensis]